jgi:Amt family ammonium transporter
MDTSLYKAIFDHIKSPVIIASSSGIIDSNPAFLKLFGIPDMASLLADAYYTAVAAEAIANARTDDQRRTGRHDLPTGTASAVSTGNGHSGSETVADRLGRFLPVEITVSELDKSGQLYLLEFRSMADAALYDEMSIQAVYTRELFDNSQDAIVIVDNHGRVMDANKTFEAMFSYTRLEAVGKAIDDLVVPPEGQDEARQLFNRVLNQERVESDIRRRSKTGAMLDIHAIAYPILIDRKFTGNYVIYKDVSHERRTERLLHEKEQSFEQLFNRSMYPIAILDREELILDVNLEFERLFGYQKAETIGRCINDLVVPEGYSNEAGQFRETVFGKSTMSARTKRHNKAGELIDVDAVGSPVIIDAAVAGMFAMYRDIRPEVQALEALSTERAYFRQLYDNSPNAVAIMDRGALVMDINASFAAMFGYSLAELRGQRLHDFIVSDDQQEQASQYARLVVDERQTVLAEVTRIDRYGVVRELDMIAFPIILNSDTLGAYVIYQDITERKHREREIQNMMDSDSLTGLYSRSYAYSRLASQLQAAIARNGSLGILYMDLDRFKEINDTRGHSAGDLVLKEFANRLHAHFSAAMDICRIGGDEFLAILKSIEPIRLPDAVDKVHWAEAIISAIQALFDVPVMIEGQALAIRPSIGWAIFPMDGSDLDQLVSKADTRMYADKKLRRVLANPSRNQTPLESLLEERQR